MLNNTPCNYEVKTFLLLKRNCSGHMGGFEYCNLLKFRLTDIICVICLKETVNEWPCYRNVTFHCILFIPLKTLLWQGTDIFNLVLGS